MTCTCRHKKQLSSWCRSRFIRLLPAVLLPRLTTLTRLATLCLALVSIRIYLDVVGVSLVNKENVSRTFYYNPARTDRSGAFILDMLFAHAYGYHHNAVYGGVCTENWNQSSKKLKGRKETHERLIHAVGLEGILHIACPPSNLTKGDDHVMLRDNVHRTKDTAAWTSDYLDFLRASVNYPPKQHDFTIAVHIRRGDINPCWPPPLPWWAIFSRSKNRYLPNSHFMELIDRYIETSHHSSPPHVVIYSESRSFFESFDEFRERGFEVVLDGDVTDAWKAMVSSDVLIMSKSDFSYVPAALAKGIVVYSPFSHDPLPGWEIVDEKSMNVPRYESTTTRESIVSMCKKRKGQNL
jgi:hypothetical protein